MYGAFFGGVLYTWGWHLLQVDLGKRSGGYLSGHQSLETLNFWSQMKRPNLQIAHITLTLQTPSTNSRLPSPNCNSRHHPPSSLMSGLAKATLKLTRLAIRVLGPAPAAVLAAATAILIYYLRRRPRRRPRRRTVRASAEAPAAAPGPAWLSSVRRATLGARFVPGDAPISSHLFAEHAETGALVVRDDAVPAIKRLAGRVRVYVVTEVASDEGEEKVKAALRGAGLFADGLLDERKVLFCETALGRVSVARQLDPDLHVDESAQVVSALQRFVPYIGLIGGEGGSGFSRNVFRCASLGKFLG